MSAKNDENPCQVSGASPRGSRLLKYLDDVGDRLGELTADLDLQLELNNSDEGYPGSPKGSPPARRSLNLRSRGRPHEKMQDATNVLVLSNLPDVPYPKTQFAEDTLYNCGVGEKAEIRLGKRPDMLFIYNLSAASQRRLASFMKQHFPQVLVTLTMGVPPYSYREDTTEMLLNILRSNQREQMSYHEIYKDAPRGYLILTNDFPYDTNRLVEVNQGGFHGIRLRDMLQRQSLDSRHLMCLISVRCLAPLVHRMISTESRLLDRRFLESLSERILTSTSQILDSAIIALAVEGEALKKPLEHLVTCVPGVEVVWTENRKVIRKLELPERAGAEPPLKVQAVANSNQEALHKEQEIVKILSDILKRPSNLYMSLDELESALRQRGRRVERSLRQFITERPKHFQILGESDYEVVTLSHRAQIKRVCNDLQKVLRPRKPKCISSADIAAAFARHWHATNEMEQTDRRFNVEDFGVCYLDDLLVTIPQHWGVHCSEYVSTDGVVVRRVSGDGEEDVPEFVPRYPADRVFAWIPRSNQTETQKKSLALLKQQVLNMFRGDPSAEALIEYLTRQNRSHGPDHNRLIRLAYLRANRPSCHQGPSHNGRDNPTLPCNLEFEEKTFVPLYHRFCGEQVALNRFGVKDLFELFDSMMDTFIATGHGQDRKISLTSDARREILERRIIDILRMSKRSMTMSELLQTYKRQPTMSPYFNEFEIKRALVMSKLIERAPRIFGGDLYRVRPIFECSLAVAVQPDIGHVLTIFMLSYAPLDVETIGNRFSDRTGRSLDESVLRHLENAGAIRLVTEFTQLYDLHDVCRVVRNLVYKMNELPSKIYTVESPPYTGMNLLSNREVSVASLLSFSGDFTFIEPETLNRIMCDFAICFEEVGDYQFKLRQELMAWVPAPEETDNAQNRRTTRTSNQTFRGAPRSRQNLRFQRHQPPNSHYQRTGHRQGGNNAH